MTDQTRKTLTVGSSDYCVVSSKFYYVDKTLMIKDYIDNRGSVTLFTRPRRFGKTLNMDMLKTFFEKTGEDTSVYFKDKKIWQCGSEYTDEQGRYPVIYLTFKDVKFSTWKSCLRKLENLISDEFNRHREEILASSNISERDKDLFSKIWYRKADEEDYMDSLALLCRLLDECYNKGLEKKDKKHPYVLIDEYDTVLIQAYTGGYYAKAIEFMRNFFSAGLKDNEHISYGILTGINRIAQASLFSGLNNLKVFTVMDDEFSEYFGFTRDEVKGLLAYYGYEDKYEDICRWYDGYRIGNSEIFNPWSVLMSVSDGCKLEPYWANTGSNSLIADLLMDSSGKIKRMLEMLLRGESVKTEITKDLVFSELKNNEMNIFTLLLFAGYLKIDDLIACQDARERITVPCTVVIPNKEIRSIYKTEILNKFRRMGCSFDMIWDGIMTGNPDKIQQNLASYILKSVSYQDEDESFYHGLVDGFFIHKDNEYIVKSEGESGYGRYDLQLEPYDKNLPGIVFEIKYLKAENASRRSRTGEKLQKLSEEALKQTDDKLYITNLRQSGVKDIIKIGIAFSSKDCRVSLSEDKVLT
ncbi:MAG: ATP-binding protein [Clostridia bacterium]|nr:ATP-binding protein [Clostridia bacterium]